MTPLTPHGDVVSQDDVSYPQGMLADQILAVLADGSECDGYDVCERVRGDQQVGLTPFPSLYLVLARLVEDGVLVSRLEDDEPTWPMRRLYRLADQPETEGAES
jgi:DNA-binding PadR family transcriptional regulator